MRTLIVQLPLGSPTPNTVYPYAEVQTDTRSGDDYSFNLDYSAEVGPGRLALNAFYVRTDRIQVEDSIEYDAGVQADASLLTINANDLDIRTENYQLGAEYAWPGAGGENRVRFGYAGIDDDQYEFEDEYEYLRDAIAYPEDDRFTGPGLHGLGQLPLGLRAWADGQPARVERRPRAPERAAMCPTRSRRSSRSG